MGPESVYAGEVTIAEKTEGSIIYDITQVLISEGIDGVDVDTVTAILSSHLPLSGLVPNFGVTERLANQIVGQVRPYAEFNRLLAEVGLWEASRAVLPQMGVDVSVAYDPRSKPLLFDHQGVVIYGNHNMFVDVLVEAATAAHDRLKFFMMATTDKLLPNIRPFMIPAYFGEKQLKEPIQSRVLSNKIAGLAAKLMVDHGMQTYVDGDGVEHQCVAKHTVQAQNCVSKQIATEHLTQDNGKLGMFPGGNGLKRAFWKTGIIEIGKGVLELGNDVPFVPVFWNVSTRGLMKFSYQVFYGPPVMVSEVIGDPLTCDSIETVGNLQITYNTMEKQVQWGGEGFERVM